MTLLPYCANCGRRTFMHKISLTEFNDFYRLESPRLKVIVVSPRRKLLRGKTLLNWVINLRMKRKIKVVCSLCGRKVKKAHIESFGLILAGGILIPILKEISEDSSKTIENQYSLKNSLSNDIELLPDNPDKASEAVVKIITECYGIEIGGKVCNTVVKYFNIDRMDTLNAGRANSLYIEYKDAERIKSWLRKILITKYGDSEGEMVYMQIVKGRNEA